jgi:NADH-quinone oxidoreductase subunit E
MSVRRLSPVQPESFEFTAENKTWADEQLKKFPEGRQASGIIPLLWRAQKQAGGWLPEPAIRYVADYLSMPYMRAMEVVTFYTMFNLAPVGENFVQLCGTTPCWLNGSDDLKKVCKKIIGDERQVTDDGKFSWMEVECLGACANAPMVQINDDFYEDLTAENFEALLKNLADGKPVKVGPQSDRKGSEPAGKLTSLTEVGGE